MTLSIRPVDPNRPEFAGEVSGIDIAQGVSAADADALAPPRFLQCDLLPLIVWPDVPKWWDLGSDHCASSEEAQTGLEEGCCGSEELFQGPPFLPPAAAFCSAKAPQETAQ